MNLSLSLGISRRNNGFSPARLFDADEPGFWADVRPGVVWQDVSRTTPAAVGDPVGSWLLKTASGVAYATQSTAGSRPTLQQTAGGLYYLDFTTHSLVTATITPGTDKAQIIAGVTKDSDAAAGIVAELSASSTLNNNTVALFAPGAAAANYTFRSRGTIDRTAVATTFTAPITNVVTGIGDVAGDVCRVQVNGTQVAEFTADQGSGNFSANALYIGQRGGSTVPFDGRIFSLIVRFGPNLTTNQLSSAERWTAARCGVTF